MCVWRPAIPRAPPPPSCSIRNDAPALRRSGLGHRHLVIAAAALQVAGGLIITDLESQDGPTASLVRMRRLYQAVGFDRASVMQCVAAKVLVPNSDVTALDPHVYRQFGVAIPTGEALSRPAICLRSERALVEPIEGHVWRRCGWRQRCRGRGWRRGDLRRRCGDGRRWWLRGASRDHNEQ